MMSGFASAIVGFGCREIRVPANHMIRGINDIVGICRGCRLRPGEESAPWKHNAPNRGPRCRKTPQPINNAGLE